MISKDKCRISVYIPACVIDKLNSYCEYTHKTVSEVVVEAVYHHYYRLVQPCGILGFDDSYLVPRKRVRRSITVDKSFVEFLDELSRRNDLSCPIEYFIRKAITSYLNPACYYDYMEQTGEYRRWM